MDCYDHYDHHHNQRGSLPRFVRLDLIHNPQLKSLSRNIWKMVSQTLVLEDCPSIESLPEISQPVNGLLHLKIIHCQNLKSFPSGIDNLKSLKDLCFIGTDIKSLPSAIQELDQLSFLGLSLNKSLELVPSNIHKLAKLSHLSLICCPKIQYLPELPPNLLILDLTCCTSLKALPSNIADLCLERLQFEDCPELDTKLPQEILRDFPNHAVSNPHPQGVLRYSGSEISEWFDYNTVNYKNDSCLMVQLPPPNCTTKRQIKGITFGVVCSSDIGPVGMSITCSCNIGTTVAASWSSPEFCLGLCQSDNVYIWYDKNLLGESNQGRIREEAEPWYERYAAGVTVSIRFSPQPGTTQAYKQEDPERLRSMKIKRVGVSLMY